MFMMIISYNKLAIIQNKDFIASSIFVKQTFITKYIRQQLSSEISSVVTLFGQDNSFDF